jgi:phosphoribosylformimino-5-aminoimidazole carboxamide ribotide isomerase
LFSFFFSSADSWRPEVFLDELVAAVGRERLVLDLSARKRRRTSAGGSGEGDFEYVVMTDRWKTWTEEAVTPALLASLAGKCSELLVHAVDVEGKRGGIEEDLVALLGRSATIPVTYAGGVRDMADVERVRARGGGRVDVCIGSALDIFGGSLKYDSLVQWHKLILLPAYWYFTADPSHTSVLLTP